MVDSRNLLLGKISSVHVQDVPIRPTKYSLFITEKAIL